MYCGGVHRYVADLFARLTEAEWKLTTARQRAATWGYDYLVPLGRCDRGIQTQYGEIWAAKQQQQLLSVSTKQTTEQSMQVKDLYLPVSYLLVFCSCLLVTAAKVCHAHTNHISMIALHQFTCGDVTEYFHMVTLQVAPPVTTMNDSIGMSATTNSTLPLLVQQQTTTVETSHTSIRTQAAFATHKSKASSSQTSSPRHHRAANSPTGSHPSSPKAGGGDTGRSQHWQQFKPTTHPKTSNESSSMSATDWEWQRAVLELVPGVPLLTAPATLALISQIYSAKSQADASALRQHQAPSTLSGFVGVWFVSRNGGAQAQQALEGLAQLIGTGTIDQHACSV